MKNWKRFIAACLSVTMVASIPLTAFAESSVSVTELAPKTSKEFTTETPNETDFNKILSKETPYTYFSGLEDQKKILDACKDEELFQLKEYMKYAYIHESDLKNRQSLDAYLCISETWRNRQVVFEKEKQEQLLQFIKDTNVYGINFKDGETEKMIEDFPSYMQYLKTIKKFDVPRYVELLSAFDEVKTEEDLAKAKEAFVNFEEEIYGFDETVKEKVENSSAEIFSKESKKILKNMVYDKKAYTALDEKKLPKTLKNLTPDDLYVGMVWARYSFLEECAFLNYSESVYFAFVDSWMTLAESVRAAVLEKATTLEKEAFSYFYASKQNYPDYSSYMKARDEATQVSMATLLKKAVELETSKSNDDYNGKKQNIRFYLEGLENPPYLKKQADGDDRTMFSLDSSKALQGVDTSNVLEINLHDYSGNDQRSSEIDNITKLPINAGRPFTFQFYIDDKVVYPGKGTNTDDFLSGARWWNNYAQTPYKNPPRKYQKGIYDLSLRNGYPILSHDTGNYGYSLDYLFNNTNSPGVTDNYQNVNRLFLKDSNGDYYLDSSVDHTVLEKDGTITHYPISGWDAFFVPLSDLKYGAGTSKQNFWFGMDITGNFQIPENHRINGREMIYEFSGDDDLLVYIDDVLVLDLGGIHSPVSGSINFTTGVVKEGWRAMNSNGQYEEGYVTHTIADNFKKAGKTWNNNVGSKHSLKIFYLERGYGGSTCKMRFNLPFVPIKTMTNTIGHLAGGFKNGEGNNGNKNAYNLGYTNFNQDVDSSYVMDESRATRIPNGFQLVNHFGTSSISGSWGTYGMGTRVTQKSTAMNYEYYYDPINYNITYNLDGGTNHALNPNSYNVLYGVTLQNPTKAGHKFLGWYEGDKKVTGINQGANASFSSSTDMYNKLAGRRTGNVTLTAKWEKLYALDVNAVLNGQQVSAPDGSWFTFDVYINGSLDANDVNDYRNFFAPGTRYEIKDIKPKPWKKYVGTAFNTTLSGTVGNANTAVWLEFVSMHTNKLHHNYWGFKNKEGNYQNGEGFTSRTDAFNQDYNTTFVMDESRKDSKMPKGFKLQPTYYSAQDKAYLPLGTTTTQTSNDMVFYYNYVPVNYKITFDLDGGTNNAANPSSYNVLYGVSLKVPTKKGYTFTGWYLGDTKVTGINEGKNADFVKGLTDTQKFYDELAKRQTGDVHLVAKWEANTYTNQIDYYLRGFENGEGHTGTNNSIWSINKTYRFNVDYNNQFVLDKSKSIVIPNGFALDNSFYMYDHVDGYDKGHSENMGATITQPDRNLSFQYFYNPVEYKITYDVAGGVNPSGNPTSYNVLYGKSFKAPTKTGYIFQGWYHNGVKMTGVNVGKNASFSNNTELYEELAKRQTGNIHLVAKWTPIKYTIVYEGNGATDGTTPSSTHTYDKPQTLTPNGFHKDGYYFDSWNTEPDGTGTSYQDKEVVNNLTSKNGDTITLHAQWKPINYKITYKGNGSTGGIEKTHLYNQKEAEANGYAVKTNKGYTDFIRTNHIFVGWYQNSVVNTKAEIAKIYKQGSKLTYSQLLAIHAEQVKKGLVKDTDPKVKEIILYAVWDETPSIDTSTMAKDQFYEGVDVTRADLLNGITANDKIDGSLTSQIIITRIDYSAGKLVNGKKQAAYSQTWENGMPTDAKLDTWFMQLDKNDSPVTHTITYQVKDSAGNITTAKKTIQVIYNEFPVIKAMDFQFELKYAQAGKITKEELLNKAIASGIVSASDVEDGDMKSKLELIDFDSEAFKTMKQEGFIPITYRVQDSMGPGGKGKITLKTVNVNVIVRQKKETVRYVRFINKKYYEKNANLDRNALVGKYDQIALLSANGGLHPFSVWYMKTDYRDAITNTFEKTTGTTYVYTKDDIKKMREFVKQHGVGNAKEEDALSKFADIFMTGDYILK